MTPDFNEVPVATDAPLPEPDQLTAPNFNKLPAATDAPLSEPDHQAPQKKSWKCFWYTLGTIVALYALLVVWCVYHYDLDTFGEEYDSSEDMEPELTTAVDGKTTGEPVSGTLADIDAATPEDKGEPSSSSSSDDLTSEDLADAATAPISDELEGSSDELEAVGVTPEEVFEDVVDAIAAGAVVAAFDSKVTRYPSRGRRRRAAVDAAEEDSSKFSGPPETYGPDGHPRRLCELTNGALIERLLRAEEALSGFTSPVRR